ncbi:MAG: NAD-dependent deacylase [Cyclobacteriaceae bacterium]|jgi:NAD-dependent deacetylase|nr:NAD-dependent deacylase [Cyclobacteriaceae bacterium]
MSTNKLIVLSGAGVSAESGIATFRDAGGLWEGHRVEDVASPEGWARHPEQVLDFYNQRRKKALEVVPNRGHHVVAELERDFDVTVVTQNVDDLHERAGSTRVIHLHGSLFESRSTLDPRLVYPIRSWELKMGETCARGSQLRPNIVWFGEQVPLLEKAAHLTSQADAFLVVGTSLQVYPAASLIDYVPKGAPIVIVDPQAHALRTSHSVKAFAEKATTGMEKARAFLRSSLRD